MAPNAAPAGPASAPRKSTLERAFELARSGECRTVSDIRQRLKAESFDGRQIDGPALTRQLRQLCNANRGD